MHDIKTFFTVQIIFVVLQLIEFLFSININLNKNSKFLSDPSLQIRKAAFRMLAVFFVRNLPLLYLY